MQLRVYRSTTAGVWTLLDAAGGFALMGLSGAAAGGWAPLEQFFGASGAGGSSSCSSCSAASSPKLITWIMGSPDFTKEPFWYDWVENLFVKPCHDFTAKNKSKTCGFNYS